MLKDDNKQKLLFKNVVYNWSFPAEMDNYTICNTK